MNNPFVLRFKRKAIRKLTLLAEQVEKYEQSLLTVKDKNKSPVMMDLLLKVLKLFLTLSAQMQITPLCQLLRPKVIDK